MRGLGRDLAKLGEKLQQLEMAMGEFSLQQVGRSSSQNSSIFSSNVRPDMDEPLTESENKGESSEMRRQNL